MNSTPVAVGLSHAGGLSVMQNACFPEERWSASAIMGILATPGTFALVIPDGGFVIARVIAGEGEILALGVIPTKRRRGHARRLVDAALAEARSRAAGSVFLEVAEDNEAARALYAEAGFVAVGRRPDYYRRPAGPMSALILKAALLP
jgi:[ribosomal protein S18]-alanine N-acetyltransferase